MIEQYRATIVFIPFRISVLEKCMSLLADRSRKKKRDVDRLVTLHRPTLIATERSLEKCPLFIEPSATMLLRLLRVYIVYVSMCACVFLCVRARAISTPRE